MGSSLRGLLGGLMFCTLLISACSKNTVDELSDGTILSCRTPDPSGGGFSVDEGCVGCAVLNPERAFDHNFRTHSTLRLGNAVDDQGISTGTLAVFFPPSGARPGAFVTLPGDLESRDLSRSVRIIIETRGGLLVQERRSAYLGRRLGLIEGDLELETVPRGRNPSLPSHYVYFEARESFDGVSIKVVADALHLGAPTELQVHAVCFEGGVNR